MPCRHLPRRSVCGAARGQTTATHSVPAIHWYCTLRAHREARARYRIAPENITTATERDRRGGCESGRGMEGCPFNVWMRIEENRGHTILPLLLILLQISPDDEHAVPLRSRRQFLQTTDTRKLLCTPAFRKHDVDLETIANLFVLVRTR